MGHIRFSEILVKPRRRFWLLENLQSSSLVTLLPLLLPLLFYACTSPQATDWSGVQITGRLVDTSGEPVKDGYVYAYEQNPTDTPNHTRTSILGPADAMSEPSGSDGSYQLIVPQGIYVIAARKRISGSISGPLRNGDLNGQLPEPVTAHSNGLERMKIVLGEFRQGLEGDPKRTLTTGTRIEGRVVDLSGKPLSGVHVFAYEGTFRSDPPDYMALATDENGLFQISLPGGGEYTVGGRTGLRGKPRPDDNIGFWGSREQSRVVEQGSVTEGVVIVVAPYGEVVIQ